MLRAKLNLKKVKEPANNICKPFHIEIENYLNKKYKKVSKIKDFYKIVFFRISVLLGKHLKEFTFYQPGPSL